MKKLLAVILILACSNALAGQEVVAIVPNVGAYSPYGSAGGNLIAIVAITATALLIENTVVSRRIPVIVHPQHDVYTMHWINDPDCNCLRQIITEVP